MMERVILASGDAVSLLIPFGGVASTGIKRVLKAVGDRSMKNKLKKYMEFYDYGGAKKIYHISEEIAQNTSYEIGDDISKLNSRGMNEFAKDMLRVICKEIELGASRENIFSRIKEACGSYEGEEGIKVEIGMKGDKNSELKKRRLEIIKSSMGIIENSLEIASGLTS